MWLVALTAERLRLKPWRLLADDIAAMALPVPGVDAVSLAGAAGRILANPITAARPLPTRTHAVMDGYALGSVPPGRYRILPQNLERIGVAEAVAVSAGDSVPVGAAAVALADHAALSEGFLTLRDPLKKDNIRRAGEEASAGAIIVPNATRLDARHLAVAAAAGVRTVALRRRPRVALLGCHDGEEPFPHLAVLTALLASPALQFFEAGAVRPALLAEPLHHLSKRHDLIIIVAESLGAENGPLSKALADLGGTATIHRAAMKPAKPIVTGQIGEALVLGLAGTAYATTIAAHLFLRPLLARFTGMMQTDTMLPAIAGFTRTRQPGRVEALPVFMQRQNAALLLTLAGRFGQLTALAAMHGFALIEAETGDITQGQALAYHPLLMPLL